VGVVAGARAPALAAWQTGGMTVAAPGRMEWLLPRHARKAALLAALHGGPGASISLSELRRRLKANENSGANLSIGLFRADRLIGFLLAQVEAAGGISDGTGTPTRFISIDDLRVRKSSRGTARQLLERFGSMLLERDDLLSLPIRARLSAGRGSHAERFEAELLETGFRVTARQSAAPTGPIELTLALDVPLAPELRPVAALLKDAERWRQDAHEIVVGVIDDMSGWRGLEPYWNALARQTPGAKVFQAYEYLRAWRIHLGWSARLYIVVVLRDGVPAAIAPMKIGASRWLRREQPCLEFLGEPPESDRPTVLVAPADAPLVDFIADYLVKKSEVWERMSLDEQASDGLLFRSLVPRLRAAGFHVSCVEGPASPIVEIRGGWDAYLASRTRGIRKNLKRRAKQLRDLGTLSLEASDGADAVEALERYLAVEAASWKGRLTIVGVSQSAAHLSFYRELARRWATPLGMRFRFLTVDGITMAATFGLCWQRALYSCHVTHDDRYGMHSPGVVLTALELEEAFERKDIDVMDFLSGILRNKGSWVTATLPCFNVHVDRDDWRGRHFQRFHYRFKPGVKRLFERLQLLERYRAIAEWLENRGARRE
jgi:CelD/BcsL family acetyltransferase involved in cellulose biosynthesis